MIVIYRAIDERWLNSHGGEETCQITFDQTVPVVGQRIIFGSIRNWIVAEVQRYQSTTSDIACFILIYPENEVCPNRHSWFPVQFKQDNPALSFSVCLSPELHVIEYGSNTDGQAPSGYLSTYTAIPGTARMQEDQSPWQVWRTSTYHALDRQSVYQTIQLCDCLLAKPIAA